MLQIAVENNDPAPVAAPKNLFQCKIECPTLVAGTENFQMIHMKKKMNRPGLIPWSQRPQMPHMIMETQTSIPSSSFGELPDTFVYKET